MKNILITGVNRGIGKALAEKFLNEGFFVIGTSTTGQCDFQNKNLKVFMLELSNPESINRCVKEITLFGKKIDILINNAGIAIDVEKNRVDVKDLHKTLEVNLIGTIDFTEQTIPLLNENFHVLNAASSAGSLTLTEESDDDFYPCYRISKAALNMYTRTLAIRFKDKGTVSSFHPGWVKTDMGGMNADMTPKESAQYIYNLAISKVETGQFWFKGEKMLW